MSAALGPEVMELLKQTIKETITELLPTIIKEVTPVISTIIKEITPLIMKSTANAYHEMNMENHNHQLEEGKRDKCFEDFRKKNKPKFDELLTVGSNGVNQTHYNKLKKLVPH